jgi:hypothetical protein
VSIFTIYSKHEFKALVKINFNKELEGKALMSTDIRATEHINFSKLKSVIFFNPPFLKIFICLVFFIIKKMIQFLDFNDTHYVHIGEINMFCDSDISGHQCLSFKLFAEINLHKCLQLCNTFKFLYSPFSLDGK